MKPCRKRLLAAVVIFLIFTILFMPLTAFAETPKGYVNPIKELELKKGDVNGFAGFWERLEEIRLVPYEAFLVHFDAFYNMAENSRFHPISGDTLIIKRGEVIPEYRLDVSYGPFNYTVVDTTNTAEATGEFIMKNIQFGTTEGIGILYNAGGSFSAYDTNQAGSTTTYGWEFKESRDYGNQYCLPEASYAAVARIEDDPNTMIVRADAYAVTDDGTSELTGVMVNFRVEGVKLAKSSLLSEDKDNTEIDTWADKEKGETSTSIPTALVIISIGAVTALAGAGTGGSDEKENNKKKSRYKMCLKKDFGDAIAYKKPVMVYARMVEITPEGDEIDRSDLTASLEIFSKENLNVERTVMENNYMGALVSAESIFNDESSNTGVLSIKFSGEGGSFQNNVTFRLIGDAYISLPKPNLSVLAGSGEKFTMAVEFVDFIESPTNIVIEENSLPIVLQEDDSGNYYIEVTDNTSKLERITGFYQEIPCTISANNGEEVVKTEFVVLKCYEGILIDFLGKKNEIMAYKNEEGEMPITNIGFQVGLWDKKAQELNLTAPESLEITYSDPEEIYEIIGLSFEENVALSTSSNKIYSFKADKSLPSPDRIKGLLSYSTNVGDIHMGNQTEIYLIPDLLTYSREFEEEFKKCEHIIFTYMSGELMKRKADELYKSKSKLGLKDLQTFRKHCWEIAQRIVMQEKESYMKEVYWLDERISELEFVTFIGDGAFAVAMTPLGGPLTAFLVDNAKSTFLELCEIYVNKEDAFTWETLEELIWNRYKQTIGSIDNFISMPEEASWKVKVAWTCGYFTYRLFYHWYYDEDEEGNSLGVISAIENAALDFGVSKITSMFGDYVKDVAKKDGIDFSKRIKSEEDMVEKAIVGAFDMADKGASELDKAVETIVDFVKSIQAG